MITLTSTEIAAITGGRATSTVAADATIDSVTTDSREVRPGTLFVAKPGEVTDGHRFIEAALQDGAPFALAEREVTGPQGTPLPAIIVPDVVLAMGILARHVVSVVREHGGLDVVGITGSAGKTTTKDLLAAILATQGPTVKPRGSYNGEVGLPLTVFEMTEQTRYLVAEMGATHLGNITYLTDIVSPDVGVVLMVGTAHVGEFGGVANIIKTKGELVEALPVDGTAVLNADDPAVWGMRERTEARVIPFGERAVDGVRVENVHTDPEGRLVLDLVFPGLPDAAGLRAQVRSGLIGAHHAGNVAAAAAAAFALGVDPETIVSTLDGLGPASRYRMERTERPDGVVVINDAYNANPESMDAALQTLAGMGRHGEAGQSRRTWAVLGEMLELGEESVEQHDRLGRRVVRLNIDKTLVIGRGARPTYNAAVMEGSWGEEAAYAADLDEAEALLREELQPGDVVLFKASNGSRLWELGERVANAAPAASGHGQEGI